MVFDIIQDFKDWILKKYKTNWFNLANESLWQAKFDYEVENHCAGTVPKFWD